MKASPSEPSGFLPHEDKLVEARERSPFNGSYYPDRERIDRLKKIRQSYYLAPIDTSPLRARLKSEKFTKSEIEDRMAEADELKRYFEERLKMEFAKHGLKILEKPEENAFFCEIALVELRPTLAVMNAAATTAGFFVPGAGLVRRLGTGSIAMEGMVRDGETLDVLAEFKDREADKDSLFTVRDFQRYSHARYSIDDWSEQLAKLASTTSDVKVEDSLPVTLLPF